MSILERSREHPLVGYVTITALLALFTFLLHLLADTVAQTPSLIYLYILVISLAAIAWTLPHALYAAAASIFAADFFVLHPAHVLQLDPEHAARLVIFGVVAVTQSLIQARLVETRKRLYTQYEMERNIAETLQTALLPRASSVPGYDTAYLYRPATVSAHVGGDFLDVFEIDDKKIALLLGDVTGHGIDAAVDTAEVRFSIKSRALLGESPDRCLTSVNDAICKDTRFTQQATVFLGILDLERHRLRYAIAGHEPPLLWRPGVPCPESLKSTGLPLGVVDSSVSGYESRCAEMIPGTTLLVYTDGVTEARHGKEFFGSERAAKTLVRLADQPGAAAVNRLFDEISAFAEGDLRDDVAILWVHRPADSPASG